MSKQQQQQHENIIGLGVSEFQLMSKILIGDFKVAYFSPSTTTIIIDGVEDTFFYEKEEHLQEDGIFHYYKYDGSTEEILNKTTNTLKEALIQAVSSKIVNYKQTYVGN